MQYLLIRNARLCTDAANAPMQTILIANGRIVGIGQDIQHPLVNTVDLDAEGKYVIPALIDVCHPLPASLSEDSVVNMNFDNISAGITTLMTVTPDIEENIKTMDKICERSLNFATHIPLRQVTIGDSRSLSKMMVINGVATAAVRFGDEKRCDIATLAPSISAAKNLGLRVIYDMRGLTGSTERISTLKSLCEVLVQDQTNKAYIIGIEHQEELDVLTAIHSKLDLAAHICYDPFGQSASELHKLTPDTIVETLRSHKWCTFGLAYSTSKVTKEGWPDMTPEIVGRNMLQVLNAMKTEKSLTLAEIVEFRISRVARLLGLAPQVGQVTTGAMADLIVWDDDYADSARVDTPRGNIQEIPLKGRIDAVVINGNLALHEKFDADAITGRHCYARIVAGESWITH